MLTEVIESVSHRVRCQGLTPQEGHSRGSGDGGPLQTAISVVKDGNAMSRKDQFLWAVQTGCLVRALKDDWDMGHPIRIMAAACKVPEESIPGDIDEAAFSFLQWQFKYGASDDENKPPEWLIPFLKGNGEDPDSWEL